MSTLQATSMDPQTLELLKQMNAIQAPPMETLPVEEVRQQVAGFAWPSPVQLQEIKNISIPGPNGDIPIRIYTPDGEGPFPVFIYLHGGGWVFGTLDMVDHQCRSIANQAGVIVVSVDYHLAPEYKFPKPLMDCYVASEWVANHITRYSGNPSQIAIGGDSSGGNLAIATTLLAREKGTPKFQYQVLIYPVTQCDLDSPSFKQFGQGYILTRSKMDWFWNHYLNKESERNNHLAAPLHTKDLSHLPPALIVLAEYDPLFDDGKLYGEKLAKAGVDVKIKTYPSIHVFFNMANQLTVSQQAIDEVAEQLSKVFSTEDREK